MRAPVLHPTPSNRPLVWLVEDSALEAEVASRALHDFRVEVFSDGHTALESLTSTTPDVLLLDWMLPDISGIELCRFIRSNERTRTLPILMMSARQERVDVLEGLSAGADDYLTKPFEGVELVVRVTALLRTRQTLERAERAESALRGLLEHLPDAVVAFDDEERITFVNIEAMRVIGQPREKVLTRAVGEVLVGLLPESISRDTRDSEPRADVAIGDRIFAPLIRSLPTGDARTTTVVLRDVTIDRTDALQSRVADQRKDEFLAMLGHELRNPLSAIGSAVQVMQLRQNDANAVAKATAVLTRQVVHMTRLVDDLLDVSRITRGKIELRRCFVDVVAVVKRAIDTAHPLIEAQQHRLEPTLPDEELIVDGDPTRLEQVVINLLGNAAKYTPPGGDIKILVRRVGPDVEIAVRDSGIGIPAESLRNIFDLFTQLQNSLARTQGGLGIGLTLVRSLVEMHGGSIRAASEGLSHGSEFTVKLPLSRVAGARSEIAAAIHPTIARADAAYGRRILVVDDNVDIAQMTAEVLTIAGYSVSVANDGPAALEAFTAAQPEVVLLDLGLPGLDGYEVAKRLRAIPLATQPVLIAISGYAQEPHVARSREAAFDRQFVKPVDFDALMAFLAALPWLHTSSVPPAPQPATLLPVRS